MKTPLPPYHCSFSPNIPELLNALNISLVLSTYQAGKVIILSPNGDDNLVHLPRNFDNPMGIAIKGDKMAIAQKSQVTELKNNPEMAATYPKKTDTYDGMYLPRSSYYTGQLALHDMYYNNEGDIVAVNTLFSCLSKINNEYSYTPLWKPDFIKDYTPTDSCHLNGMAIDENSDVKYVSALGKTTGSQGWRENKMAGGILIDTQTNNIILENLSMPHSPRIYNNKIYFLNSAQGELCAVDTEKGTHETVCQLGGYARGMDKYGDYLFIGVSKLRHHSKVFGDLPIAKTSFAGIVVVYLPYGNVVGTIKYETSVEEIYDCKVIEGYTRPGILNNNEESIALGLTSPGSTYWSSKTENK